MQMFRIFQIEIFSNFPNLKFLELSKLENKEISRFFFNLENQSLAPKIGNFGIVPYSIFHATRNFDNS